uniref:Uncharacterized protein n=1 Tax=Denticeps clupeoides TaxID=299321 RepID=A0AAY4AZP4_9TELE
MSFLGSLRTWLLFNNKIIAQKYNLPNNSALPVNVSLSLLDIDELSIIPSVCGPKFNLIPSVCGPNSHCTNTIGSYTCSCLNGFSVTSPDFSINVNNMCQDVNECAVIPSVCGPNSNCTNTIGSYTCSCLNGFSVTSPGFSINNVNNMCQGKKYMYSNLISNLTTAATENSPAIAQSAATVQSIVTILNNIAEVSKGIKINRLVMEVGVTEALADDPLVITTGFLQLSRSVLSSAAAALAVNSTAEIFIPDTQIPGNNTVLTTVAFSNQSNFLPVRSKASFNDTSSKINAIVLLIKVKNATFNNISLTFDLINDNFTSPQCVFWNFNLFGVGGWDTSGCRPKYKSNGTVTCECNHLTSFSILMSPYVPEDEAKVLDFITYIGVGISMGSLVACLIIEILVWKSMTRTPTSYIHHVSVVNIAVCLLIADVWFIVGAAETARKHENPDACNAAVFFMHLFYLALFFWMLVSAAFFCRAVFAMTKVSKSTMRAISFSVGYVPPILIAVVTIAVTAPADNYLSENACWLRWDRSKTLLAFVVPALTIVAANLTILLAVIIKMLTRMGGKTSQVSEKHSLVLIGRCVAVLTPIFGLTWALGIGIVTDPGNYGLHVSFAFFNSLQVGPSPIFLENVNLLTNGGTLYINVYKPHALIITH